MPLRFPKIIKKRKLRKTIPRIRKNPLSKLKRIADKLAGDICRSKGYCEAKGYGTFKCTNRLQWCHIFSRRYQRLRWLPQNALCMCSSHHVYFTYNPNEWVKFLMDKYNDTYQWLYQQKESYVKIDRMFLERTIKELQ